MAAATLTLNHSKVPLGSPLEITYQFKVAASTRFTEDYRVFVHFKDADDELMWTDDHLPTVPTSQSRGPNDGAPAISATAPFPISTTA